MAFIRFTLRVVVALSFCAGTVLATLSPSAAQAGDPTLSDTLNTLLGLCTTVREDFGDKAREAGWPYDMATGERARELSFGKVTVASEGEFACMITFAMTGAAASDVTAGVEQWAQTGDPDSTATRNADGSVQVTGAGYLLRAEAGAAAATIWVKLI